ncbi:hypothetical protein GCM10010447_58290 [Streptomyces fulvorobeus]
MVAATTCGLSVRPEEPTTEGTGGRYKGPPRVRHRAFALIK